MPSQPGVLWTFNSDGEWTGLQFFNMILTPTVVQAAATAGARMSRSLRREAWEWKHRA